MYQKCNCYLNIKNYCLNNSNKQPLTSLDQDDRETKICKFSFFLQKKNPTQKQILHRTHDVTE